jgi:hypothetical protein
MTRKVGVSSNVSPQVLKLLEDVARARGVSVAAVVRIAIDNYIDELTATEQVKRT